MYGILTIRPYLYTIPGNDDTPRTSPINNFDDPSVKDLPMEYKLKIKSELAPLFTNMNIFNSENRIEMLKTLRNSNAEFANWYLKITTVGDKLTGQFGWYGRSFFYLGINIEIKIESGDIVDLTYKGGELL